MPVLIYVGNGVVFVRFCLLKRFVEVHKLHVNENVFYTKRIT